MYGEKRNAYRVFVRKHEGKDHMEDPHNESMDDIKMCLTETGLEDVD